MKFFQIKKLQWMNQLQNLYDCLECKVCNKRYTFKGPLKHQQSMTPQTSLQRDANNWRSSSLELQEYWFAKWSYSRLAPRPSQSRKRNSVTSSEASFRLSLRAKEGNGVTIKERLALLKRELSSFLLIFKAKKMCRKYKNWPCSTAFSRKDTAASNTTPRKR